jgi:peptidyl-prolyl cis-trans isomerase C
METGIMAGMYKKNHFLPSLLMIMILVGCGSMDKNQTPAPTLSEPTPTLEPMVAIVNGEGITVAEYQSELDSYLAAMSETGITSPTGQEPREVILTELINERLLSQGASQAGLVVSQSDLDERVNQLANQLGGVQALQSWESDHGYTDESFQNALRRSVSADWMKQKILAGVPHVAEQIHARQILFTDEPTALAIKAQLDSGADFTAIAEQYDPINGGDLGWFPRGYLLIPEVEDAAFSLEIGKYSDIIPSTIGWHIVLVMEKDSSHQLSPDALLTLQHQAIQHWLSDQRAISTIQILTQ